MVASSKTYAALDNRSTEFQKLRRLSRNVRKEFSVLEVVSTLDGAQKTYFHVWFVYRVARKGNGNAGAADDDGSLVWLVAMESCIRGLFVYLR